MRAVARKDYGTNLGQNKGFLNHPAYSCGAYELLELPLSNSLPQGERTIPPLPEGEGWGEGYPLLKLALILLLWLADFSQFPRYIYR